MKIKVLLSFLSIVIITIVVGYTSIFQVSSDNIDITLTSIFDNDNSITTVIDVGDGSSFSLDENVGSINNYVFEFFIVDGVVQNDLLLTNVFTVTENTFIQAVFSLSGEVVLVFVDSNGALLDIQYIIEGTDGVEPDIEYPEVDGYHLDDPIWDNVYLGVSVSTVFILQYEIDAALYAVEEFYFTDFEDGSKSSYEIGLLTTASKQFTLSDALIGTLGNDQMNDYKSIRLRNGYIITEFAVDELYEISFFKGKYLSDGDSTFSLEISSDKTTWITLDSAISSTSTFELYEFTLDETVYTDLGLSAETAYYIRISSAVVARVNIDDFTILQLVSLEPEVPDPLESETLTISLPSNMEIFFSLGDTWTDDGCTAIDSVIGEVTCTVTGTVDTSNIGGYDITYTAVDGEGLYKVVVVEHVVFRDESLLEIDYTGYYDGIEGLYGEELLLALREILNTDLIRTSYDEARYILDETDVDPNNPNNIILIYTRDSISGIWDNGTTWNREHVWPNSFLGIPRVSGSDRNIASDLHNLRAADPGENSSRSNEVYSIFDTADTYYPGVDATGDVARIIFYMAVMYEELEIVNYVLPNDPNTNYTPDGAKMAILDYLITWHYEEPIDAFEVNRNEVIYTYQNNRNPFIDYAYLVELIWYDATNIPE
ncbi:MAG: endonuclease [Candidatus Izemoplasma sp.]